MMIPYVEPPHKSLAQREADVLLLRNAPDEDQVLREYLAKHAASQPRHKLTQSHCDSQTDTVVEADCHAAGGRSWRSPMISSLERARKARADYGHDGKTVL